MGKPITSSPAMIATEIDLRLVWAYMHRCWWVVPTVMAAVIALIIVLSWSVTESFEASTMVRLAKGAPKNAPGPQGMVVHRLQSELSQSLSVKFYPRPTGVVMVVSQADEREAALRNAKLAADRLVQDSNKATEYPLKKRADHIATMEQHLTQLNQLISQRMAAMSDEQLENTLLSEVLDKISPVVGLMKARDELEIRIISTKVENEMTRHRAAIISPLVVDDKPVRPHWARNIIIGIVFGLGFGLFVVFLLAVFDQLVRSVSGHDKC